jgi:hypothetical protein
MQNLPNTNVVEKHGNRSKATWREIITSWEKSGQNTVDFCERMNINIGTFRHWRTFLNKETVKNNFVELKVAASIPEKLSSITIESPSGYKIILPSMMKSEAIKIFKILGLIA